MAQVDTNPGALKQAVKEAVVEVLHEQRGLLYEILAEVLEDRALAEAIREGHETKPASRDEVFRVLLGKA